MCPHPDWGPSLPEIRRKYSYDARLGVPEDDDEVFPPDGAELVSVKTQDPEKVANGEKERLVSFKEGEPETMEPKSPEEKEKPEEPSKGDEKTDLSGAGDAGEKPNNVDV